MMAFWNYHQTTKYIDLANRIYVGTWIANYDIMWKVVHSQCEGTGHIVYGPDNCLLMINVTSISGADNFAPTTTSAVPVL